MPMERLLKIVQKAGRTPNVEGGGELNTRVTTHDYWYPQLYISQDGTGVDEIAQILSGGTFVMHQMMTNKDVF